MTERSSDKLLIKIVSGRDTGGTLSAELAFTRELKRRGVLVYGLIIESGPASAKYGAVFNKSIPVQARFNDFRGSVAMRVFRVVRHALETFSKYKGISVHVQHELRGRHPIGLAVRWPQFVLLAGLLGRSLECPVYWHMPNTVSSPVARGYFRFVLDRFQIHAIGNSPHTLSSLGEDNGDIVFPGYDPTRLRPCLSQEQARTTLGLPLGVSVFSVAARLTWAKAPDLVLGAFVKSSPFKAGAHLVLAGGPIDGEIGKMLRNQALEQGDGRVHIIGETDDVGTLYAASNVFINGRRNAEPFGISIAEALASGVPVVALREGGPSEMIIDRKNGWFVEAPTVDGYLNGIQQAWNDRNSWGWMGEVAKESVRELTVSQQVDKYLAILQRSA